MKPTLEQLYRDTHAARVAAGDTFNFAHSAALAAVHRAGMLDAAEIVLECDDNDMTAAECVVTIRRAASEVSP